MDGRVNGHSALSGDRIELILRRLDALPTLGAVAVRLLDLTADEEADASEITTLVASDPALASKVLAMCRCHARGRTGNVTTVERAVLLLGFEAVRCVVLSVRIFEVVDALGNAAGEDRNEPPVFDRKAFWMHSLGVAVASEQLAPRGTLTKKVSRGEAFMAGLLHDLGQLALHVLLPDSFDQVCRVAETHSASLDHACRQIIGIDTHTAGKRLAEHWQLPAPLVDAIWLCGQAHEALPPVPHRDLISVVTLADALVRTRYINPAAHWPAGENIAARCVPVGISRDEAEQVAADLHNAVTDRATALGLMSEHDPAILLRSICRANDSLARTNLGMRQREAVARRQAAALSALASFLEAVPSRASAVDALGHVAASIPAVLDARAIAAVYETEDADRWRLVRFARDGREVGGADVDAPEHVTALRALVRDLRGTAPALPFMPWLAGAMPSHVEVSRLYLYPLAGHDEASAIFLLDTGGEHLELPRGQEGLIECWRAAIGRGVERDRAAALTEQLAHANRELIETQEALARSRTMSTLGEVAAGAAHEMNNPLTVISGRSQILAHRLTDPGLRAMAEEVFAQSHRISDMITALRSFAEPVTPNVRAVDITDLVVRTVQRLDPENVHRPRISTIFPAPLPPVHVDPDLLEAALAELVRNAVEAKGSSHIELRVQTDPLDGRLKIEVRDDGAGLDEHALRHAFDPFFSSRPAGRQPGLGLPRARRFIEAHRGKVSLVSGPTGGAVATIWLSNWRGEPIEGSEEQEREAA